MQILAADLGRLCYNAIQVSARDSSLGGAVMFSASSAGELAVYACDDYVALVDQAADVDDPSGFCVGLRELRELERYVRDHDGRLDVTTDAGQLRTGGEAWPLAEDPPDFRPVLSVLEMPPRLFHPGRVPFAIRASRFAKFRLLRTPDSPSTRDEYPVDFLWDGDLLRWRCGPYLRGVVAPLTRESWTTPTGEEITGIEDLFGAEREEVLW